jgi:Tol biopolymer transport system component
MKSTSIFRNIASFRYVPLFVGVMGLLSSCGKKAATEPPGPELPPSTKIAAFGSLPRWSPDSQKLLFGADGVNAGLWIYDRAGGSLTQITDGAYPHLYDYRWSPDGDKIAFGGAGAVIENRSGIYVVALDGSDPVRWHATGYSPDWSPDGTKLVFVEADFQAGHYGLYTLNFADSSVSPLVGEGQDPRYDPGGTKIAYRCPVIANQNSAFQLKMIIIGAAPVVLADTCTNFNWVSDGTAIIYDSFNPSGTGSSEFRINRLLIGGGAVVKLSSSGIQSSVAPGGIAYQAVNGDLSDGLYWMTLNGTNKRQITDTGFQPSLAPDGTLVAYAREDGIWLVEL